MKRQNIITIISCALIFLLAYAALSKLFDYRTFRLTLRRSPLLYPFASVVAIAIPTIELIIALLLLIPVTRLFGLYATLALIALFTFYIFYMIIASVHLPCSCGGVIKVLSWKQHVFFNLFFIIASTWGILLYKKENTESSDMPP